MANHTLRVYESMLGLLSDEDNPTPLVRLHRVVPFEHARVYAKLEWYNPFGAVKDRVAANLIRVAEETGDLGPIKKLVEATSGNTGMGLAMLANQKGYKLTATLSDAIPLEKRTMLRFFGVDVVELDDSLCPAPGAPEGAIARADEIGELPDFFQPNQYENEANPGAHYLTTGPEIWKQTGGEVTHFFAGLGTCGTITGTGRFLKKKNPEVKVIGVHPAEGHDIPGVRSIRQLKQTSFYLPDEYDGHIEIDDDKAFRMCLRLNQEESIVAGPSSGMALAGAIEAIPDEPGVVAVVIFPDNVFKYATSVVRHLPELFPRTAAASEGAPSDDERTLKAMIDNARRSGDVIDVGELDDLLMEDGKPVIIDVRSDDDFSSGHIEDSINIPLEDLAASSELPGDRDQLVVTVCNVGSVSLTAMLILKSLGYHQVRNLMGGLTAWQGEGMPLES
jgi:cysteine synthase/rhodanese-related sulfurtransferase